MNQVDTVSQIAAVIYAARTAGKYPSGDDQQRFCEDAANEAWDLYHAVQFTSTRAAERGTARYLQDQ